MIASNIDYCIDECKYNKILVPVVDSLYNTIITKLNNIFYNDNRLINLPKLLNDIKDCYGNFGYNIDSYIQKEQNYDFIIKKLFKVRSNRYSHLGEKNLLSSKVEDKDYKMTYREIEELLYLAKEILTDLYSVIFNITILTSDKDDDAMLIDIQKIKKLLE